MANVEQRLDARASDGEAAGSPDEMLADGAELEQGHGRAQDGPGISRRHRVGAATGCMKFFTT